MSRDRFEYPFYIQAVYSGICTAGFLAPFSLIWYPYHWMVAYYCLILFLGLGLRPIIERLRLIEISHHLLSKPFEKRRAREAMLREVKARHDAHAISHRHRHKLSDDLPPNW